MTATADAPAPQAPAAQPAPATPIMTGVDLFRALKDSGTGESYLTWIRRILRGHREKEKARMRAEGVAEVHLDGKVTPMTARDLIQEMGLLRDDAGKLVIQPVTMRKCANLMAGKHADLGSRVRPEEWDDDIDGPFVAEMPMPTAAELATRGIKNPPVPETADVTPPAFPANPIATHGISPPKQTISVHNPSPDAVNVQPGIKPAAKK
jgi:hypothetical protein